MKDIQHGSCRDPRTKPPGRSITLPAGYDRYSINICHNDLSEGVVNRGGSDGAHLRCLRQKHRITLARAATALQTHPTRLSQLGRGQYHSHHLATQLPPMAHHPPKPDLTKIGASTLHDLGGSPLASIVGKVRRLTRRAKHRTLRGPAAPTEPRTWGAGATNFRHGVSKRTFCCLDHYAHCAVGGMVEETAPRIEHARPGPSLPTRMGDT